MATKKATTKKANTSKKPAAKKAPAKKAANKIEAPAKPKGRAAFKLDDKRAAKMDAVLERLSEASEEEGEAGGKIRSILALYAKGFERREIVAYGFNKSTVYRQTKELDRYKKAPALSYYGHDLFEARIQKLMSAKKISRDKAVDIIMGKDLEA